MSYRSNLLCESINEKKLGYIVDFYPLEPTAKHWAKYLREVHRTRRFTTAVWTEKIGNANIKTEIHLTHKTIDLTFIVPNAQFKFRFFDRFFTAFSILGFLYDHWDYAKYDILYPVLEGIILPGDTKLDFLMLDHKPKLHSAFMGFTVPPDVAEHFIDRFSRPHEIDWRGINYNDRYFDITFNPKGSTLGKPNMLIIEIYDTINIECIYNSDNEIISYLKNLT